MDFKQMNRLASTAAGFAADWKDPPQDGFYFKDKMAHFRRGEKRVTMKIGRYLSTYSDYEGHTLEKVVSYLCAAETPYADEDVEILEGQDIWKGYYWDNYTRSEKTSLQDSCMRHDSCKEYLEFYMCNPNVVKLAVVKDDEGKVKGRALIWYTADAVILDRVYGLAVTALRLKAWAQKRGWWVREIDAYSEATKFITPDGDKRQVTFFVQMGTLSSSRKFPYLDTFKFAISADRLSLVNGDYCAIGQYQFCAIGGSCDEYHMVEFDGMLVNSTYVYKWHDGTLKFFPHGERVAQLDDGTYALTDDVVVAFTYIEPPSSVRTTNVLRTDTIEVDGRHYLSSLLREHPTRGWVLPDERRIALINYGYISKQLHYENEYRAVESSPWVSV